MDKKRHLYDLLLLFVAKSGSIIVGILIIPFFNRILEPESFGVAALIISLQALLMLLDFGLNTTIARDLATSRNSLSQKYQIWRSAERAISIVYLYLLPISILISFFFLGEFGLIKIIGCAALFWSLAVQNIGQSTLLARQHIKEAALLQVFGLIARHGITATALVFINSSITCFIIAQCIVAIAHMLATRWRCALTFRSSEFAAGKINLNAHAIALLRSGKSLMLISVSGAAVLQLDKIIISFFMPTKEVGPYFLATTFCMTPISVFAGPISQFFQPRLISSASMAESNATQKVLNQFLGGIALCTLLPTGLIWLMRAPLIETWLHGTPDAIQVANYSAILLPGIAIGALGFIPYALLVQRHDHLFQARLSVALTTLTLSAVAVAATFDSIIAICITYVVYHIASTSFLWMRCIYIEKEGGIKSSDVAKRAIFIVVLICSIFYSINKFIN